MTAGNRYRLGRTLGKGGMGAVYEARDEKTGRTVALKRLLVVDEDARDDVIALFQREYHTLSRLSHPAVVEVFEYGVDEIGPFYTMELLEGADLRSVLPLPFERACAVLCEVASALSLLHTRHLVHRDITSRNIRVIGDGRAKLLDFGALAPIGYSGAVVGTPPFVPPEAAFCQPLDARSDLFSFGVVLYQTLSGHVPYRGNTWAEIHAAWQGKAIDLGAVVPGLPPELVRLTMSLIAPNRSARPRHAGQVLEQLSQIAGLPASEPPSVARSYLIAPDLVARDVEMERVCDAVERARRHSGGGLVVTGPAGVGRSRLLEEAVLEARIEGAIVLSPGSGAGEGGGFAVARSLVEVLLRSAPVAAARAVRQNWSGCKLLFERGEAGGSIPPPADSPEASPAPPLLKSFRSLLGRRPEAFSALRFLFLAVARECCLVLVLDDIARIDEPSAAWLATLLRQAPAHRLLLVASLGDSDRGRLPAAHRLILDLGEELRLRPFDADEVLTLVRSVFGAVPNTDTVAATVFRLSQGLVRDAMALCEHLVDVGLVTYGGGSFLLPPRIEAGDLPSDMAAAHTRVVASLSPPALHLGRAMTLAAAQSLTIPECIALSPGGDGRLAQLALDELGVHRAIASDGHRYRLVHEAWARAFAASSGEAEAVALHRAIADLPGVQADATLRAYHLLLGRRDEEALATLRSALREPGEERLEALAGTRLSPRKMSRLLDLAVEASRRLGRPRSEVGELQHARMMLGVYVDYASFEELRPTVLEDLRRDSGLAEWCEPAHASGALPAALEALQAAQARFDATPPGERMRSPEAALRALAQFAAAGIAVGAQASDWAFRRSLPDLLRPFACLSPALDAIHENCLSVHALSLGRFELYLQRSLTVLERLAQVDLKSLPYGEEIRAAVTYGAASAEARMGIRGALERLSGLAGNPRLHANVMDLRAYVLLQQGDWKEAAACHRAAEQLDLESPTGQMFGSKYVRNDSEIYALGGDLEGVKQVIRRLEALSGMYRGWLPSLHLARGDYERLRGDARAALASFDACLALLEPLMTPAGSAPEWYSAIASKIEVLVEMERHDEALDLAREVLAGTASWSSQVAPEVRFHGILRAMALAEGGLGAHAEALRRLEPAIEERLRLGATGVHLGLLHEAHAYVALWSKDFALYEQSARLAGEQFCLVEDSAFFPRARRLLEAGRLGARSSEPPGSHRPMPVVASEVETVRPSTDPTRARVAVQMARCSGRHERATLALTLLCAAHASTGGQLYLLTEHGFFLAASTRGAAVAAEVARFAKRRLDAELAASEMTTVAVQAGVRETSLAAGADALEIDGQRHSAHILGALLADSFRIVGVVVVSDEGDEPATAFGRIVDAVSRALIDSGDVLAVEAA